MLRAVTVAVFAVSRAAARSLVLRTVAVEGITAGRAAGRSLTPHALPYLAEMTLEEKHRLANQAHVAPPSPAAPPPVVRSDWFYIGLLTACGALIGLPLLFIAELQDEPDVRDWVDARVPSLLPALRLVVDIPHIEAAGWRGSQQPKGGDMVDAAVRVRVPGGPDVVFVRRVRADQPLRAMLAGTAALDSRAEQLYGRAELVILPVESA